MVKGVVGGGGEHAWQGECAEQAATEAGGTHPTGMHSCFFLRKGTFNCKSQQSYHASRIFKRSQFNGKIIWRRLTNINHL